MCEVNEGSIQVIAQSAIESSVIESLAYDFNKKDLSRFRVVRTRV